MTHYFCGFLCLLLLLLMDFFGIIVWWISLSVPHLEFIAFPHCWDNPAVFILTHKRPLQFKSALSSKYIWLVAALLMSHKPRYGSEQQSLVVSTSILITIWFCLRPNSDSILLEMGLPNPNCRISSVEKVYILYIECINENTKYVYNTILWTGDIK